MSNWKVCWSETRSKECAQLAHMLEVLAEVDYRRLALERGYSSLFKYCLGKLNLSEAQAYRRIRVARMVRCFPEVLEPLRSGEIHLTALSLLAPSMTEESPSRVENGTDSAQAQTPRAAARIEPWAWGGANTAENLTLRCRPHNLNDPATREKTAELVASEPDSSNAE